MKLAIVLSAIGGVALAALVVLSAGRVSGPPDLPGGVPRLELQAGRGVVLQAVDDFVVRRDTLWVVDAGTSRVLALRRNEQAWEGLLSFGGAGGGPGEFRHPTGITLLDASDEIAVADDGGRIQFFNTDGRFLRSTWLGIPCAPSHLQMETLADSLLLVAGNCRGQATEDSDTLYTKVYWSADGGAAHPVAKEARLAVDGSWGSAYAPQRTMSPAPGGGVLFGVGFASCVRRISMDGASGGPTVTTACDLPVRPVSSPSPPGFDRDLRRAARRDPRLSGRAFEWPDPLPFYVGAIVVESGTLLVRPVSHDSVVVELAAGDAREVGERTLMVAPLESFVGCSAGGCLWYESTMDGDRIALLRGGDLDRLARSAAGVE